MALELHIKNTNFYPYRGCAGNYDGFYSPVGAGGMCGTSSKVYFESIVSIDSFVYDAAIDKYRFVTWMNIANWPTWDIMTSIINPETGVEEQRTSLAGYAAVGHAWTGPALNAGLNKIVAGYIATQPGVVDGIVDLTMPDIIPSTAQVSAPYVTRTQITDFNALTMGFALCPERKLVTLSQGNYLKVYDYSPYPSASILKWWHPSPETFCWSVGYENDENMWGLFSASLSGAGNDGRQSLLKYNFYRNRIELLSELQKSGVPDRMASIAFDTKRKKLAAVRIKPDLANGQHDNAFEIYSPHIAAVMVTVPVNLQPISDESKVVLVSHVLGSKGEAGGSREVTISCSPTAALITTPKLVTEANGRIDFTIEPHTAGASEAITVSHVDNKVLT